ncbi:sensor histidine kinase [Deinococcus maricopensis]|uniref:histidine kinase n=1 Tax=Deinococcus maricopensis (strain DSM 21211 / LMG 22137 / NRRL B-23946 / LB-34) TaxID=709986 RepID=E8UBR7_DEIML|nr:ATP-binding protein [Deinococcus maricopensis]ADV68506.1 integral membrane sensor signal transduction histidine kinase [Deinococcus maricopensis DSM 21211]
MSERRARRRAALRAARARWGDDLPRHRRRGLRARLTRQFAFVAFVAVMLTSFLTVNTTLRVLERTEASASTAPLTGSVSGHAHGTSMMRLDQGVVRAARREVTRSAAVAAVLCAVLASLAARGVTRSLTRPLQRLGDAAARVEAGERDVTLPVPFARDELRDVTVAFNHLTAGLARQEAWRRALVADIAHDLRTPLAVLRADIEAMQDGVTPTDAAGLARLHGEVLHLARLVTDLRTLTLAEGGALSLQVAPLDAAALTTDVAAAYSARAHAAGLDLHVDAPAPAFVRADPDRLRQILHNLLDNAARYAAPGRVDLRVRALDLRAHLHVRDHGPGFREEDLARAFERFYRADASRTRSADGHAGSGLGLAIARALAQAQGGTLDARNHPDGGAEFTVTFPLTAAPR